MSHFLPDQRPEDSLAGVKSFIYRGVEVVYIPGDGWPKQTETELKQSLTEIQAF